MARLWAISSYFNPVGYRRRVLNYHAFRRHLKVPLVTIELAYGPRFELNCDDADILIQLRGGDVLWQKERLLNIALQSVPPDCDRIAWLDCDIIFGNSDWASRADRLLGEYPLLQLFTERVNLDRDAQADALDGAPVAFSAESLAYKAARGAATEEDFRMAGASLFRRTSTGLAWAARRDVLDPDGLYDACIIGNGDRVMACAAYGRFAEGIEAAKMSGDRAAHYLAWAKPFFDRVRGSVGYVDGRISHLWHGDYKDRLHAARHERLRDFGFDPSNDIALDASGCWRWSSDKFAMHQWVQHYFESRNEDGDR
ncbi:MAG TPA: hypothetical protein VL403_16010 [Candidatus Kryptonia bacterium]|nr:hypothetical protein [Candidatus Kryptonia bacterium]